MSEKIFSISLDDLVNFFKKQGFSIEKDGDLFEKFQNRFFKAVEMLESDAENYMQEALEDAEE